LLLSDAYGSGDSVFGNIKRRFYFRPIVSSIVATLILFIGWYILSVVFLRSALDPIVHRYMDGTIRAIAAIPAILLLGVIVGQSGFAYTFSRSGSKQAAFASLAMILCIVVTSPHYFVADYISLDILRWLLPLAYFDIANAVWEEVLWRGLLMTAILYYWGDRAIGRLLIMFLSSAVFGLMHFSSGVLGIMIAFCLGLGLSAAYIYSKNLLVVIAIHALVNYIARFVTPSYEQLIQYGNFVIVLGQAIVIFAIVPIFAIYCAIKAEPFSWRMKLPRDKYR